MTPKVHSRKTLTLQARQTQEQVQLALEVSGQIGSEWRSFTRLTLIGRLWWLCTGQLLAKYVAPYPSSHPASEPVKEA
jgi:hypothetical protein